MIYKFRPSTQLKTHSNKTLKVGFYKSLVFLGEQKNLCNVNVRSHLLGRKNDFYVVNSEHHIEMLKRAIRFFYEVSKKKKILYVNDSINVQFDGIIKAFSYRASQIVIVNRWPCGVLTKNSNLKLGALLIFDPKKSYFTIKESTKLGIPIVSLNNVNSTCFETTYPIICNNLQGDSLFFNLTLLSHFILEGKLLAFLKNSTKK
jgi:ribosomal protein S2